MFDIYSDMSDAQALERMYRTAGLVHGDLSEFNMLWSTCKPNAESSPAAQAQATSTTAAAAATTASASASVASAVEPVVASARTGRLYVIDVSQAVDYCHPLAWNFLLRDCQHVIAVCFASPPFANCLR